MLKVWGSPDLLFVVGNGVDRGMVVLMYFDSHVHFGGQDGERGTDALVKRALAAGVTRMIGVGGSCELNKWAVEAAGRFPGHIAAAVGFDRDQAEEQVNAPLGLADGIDKLRFSIGHLAGRKVPVVALGEIGLDYHYKLHTAAEQVRLFDAQLDLATDLGLPVIIHSREADADTLTSLTRHRRTWRGDPQRIGVLHCFTGDAAFAREVLDQDYSISFSGIVTFKKLDDLRATARAVPDGRLLIETDTPYLAPEPHRGKRNEPAYVGHVAETLALVRGVSVQTIARQTWDNAARLFGMDA